MEITNSVGTSVFQPGQNSAPMRRQHNIPEKANVLMSISALDCAHHYRRVDLLMDVLTQMGDPSVYVMIAGDGDWLVHYQRQAKAKRIDPWGRFLGRARHHDLPSVYIAADTAVLPSQLQESFGLVLIEAMAGGKA
jgi:glycosyltransferase involved in cell wall biosynthesis